MSAVLASGLATASESAQFFAAQLQFRTDAADLAADLIAGEVQIVVIDTRSAAAYQAGHIPGAVSVPHRTMTAETTANWDRQQVYVCYCDGIGCNGSTWGAYKLAKLGFQVKELIGGLRYWQQDGYAVATGEAAGVLMASTIDCEC
ncbi:rhodanese-like domain-containing protein [Deefgea salmonis]|uniref:Rhodanese-like domain-containing protein n=1 Tax=Deefgea salmonis TaxID=2875502 RepID=A0ABS8BM62_9NEIS|nr:rhodanese-like domain-containing protein [Deefgea salmonis]MCB5196796.1 rhodanese-like domain-containing protein [Deefgea salmonis]